MILIPYVFQIYFHGSHEIPDITSKQVELETGYFLRIYLTALTIYSSERASDLKISQRKCRFHTESNLRYYPVYTYIMCRVDCRATLAKRLCYCLPHFYRKTGTPSSIRFSFDNSPIFAAGDRICDVEGLQCLAKHKGKLAL